MTDTFKITDSASNRIKSLTQDGALRVEVLGGGCSGFKYNIFVDNLSQQDEDLVFTHNGARVFIDKSYIALLENSILDHIEELAGSRFEIINPNATVKCGCGKSFGV
jgi:iron-sulfur cluster insertion protein